MRRFGAATVLGMQRLEKRAPELVRKAITVVDVLREGPEEVVEKVRAAGGGQGLFRSVARMLSNRSI